MDPSLQTAFLALLASHGVRPTALAHYQRWASLWLKADGPASVDRTTAFFDALGRSTGIADWQFRQAIHAVRLIAIECLLLPWAGTYPWDSLADQARDLPSSHRTLLRESHRIPAEPTSPPTTVSRSPTSDHTPAPGEAEALTQLDSDLRRVIRLKHLAVATEQTYCHWVARFRHCQTRHLPYFAALFCHSPPPKRYRHSHRPIPPRSLLRGNNHDLPPYPRSPRRGST